MSKYEIILFDLDDTLIDEKENIRHAFKKIIKHLNKEYKEEDFHEWLRLDKQFWNDFYHGKIKVPKEYQKTTKILARYLRSLRCQIYFKNNISLEEAFNLNEIYLEGLTENIISIEGAYDTLKYLHSKYKLVIATNGPTIAVETKLKKINCYEFIDKIFSGEMCGVSKPDKNFFRSLKNFINFYDNEKILIVGDSLSTDIKGGINAKIDTCWFNRAKEKRPKEFEPTMTIYKLKELIHKL